MKARVTSHFNHPIGKLFTEFFDCDFYSRRTGFDLNSDTTSFINDTENYDWTINLARGTKFGGVKLLTDLSDHCHKNQLHHKVFNIGSYISFLLLDMPHSSYDVEKAALKFAHKKIANEYLFHHGTLDSYLLNLNYIEELSEDVAKNYKHLHVLSLDSVKNNVNFMIMNSTIKELSLQYNQPGNHRVNNGRGLILAGMF